MKAFKLFAKSCILDVSLGSKNVSGISECLPRKFSKLRNAHKTICRLSREELFKPLLKCSWFYSWHLLGLLDAPNAVYSKNMRSRSEYIYNPTKHL